MNRLRYAILLAIVVQGTLIPGRALGGEPSASDIAQARALAVEGIELRDAGKPNEALLKFRRAWDILPTPNTGNELAKTLESVGKLLEAREVYRSIVRLPVGPKETATHRANRALASQKDSELAGRIPLVSVAISGALASSLRIRINDEPVVIAALRERPMNPGRHVLVVEADGFSPEVRTFDLAEKDRRALDVSVRPLVTSAPSVSSSQPAVSSSARPPPVPLRRDNRAWSYAGFGLAGAGVLVGAITGILHLDKASVVRENCKNNSCPPAYHSDLTTAKSMWTASTVSFAVAGVGALFGLGFWIWGGSRGATNSSAVVLPWATHDSVGISGSFR